MEQTTVVVQRENYEKAYNRYLKRFFDLCFALVFGVLFLPLYLMIGVAVVSEDGLPVFYRPLRGGYKGKPFRIIKFRTMIKDADKVGGSTTALNDPRITRVGNLLRKTKLDETPQLFNVVAGTMSLIGPRPELVQYTRQYKGEEKLIEQVRPGITDFSSIEFINLDEIVGTDNADEMYEKYVLKRKNELRVKYAREVSAKTDLMLFFKTVFYVLRKAVKFVTRNNN